MKHLTLLKQSAFATLLVSTAITAFAGGGGGGPSGPRNNLSMHAYAVAGAQPVAPAVVAAASPPADGAGLPPAAQGAPVVGPGTGHGKTRAEVGAELLQAQRMGLIPAGHTGYPPNATTIARNQARFQQAEPYWRAHGYIPAQEQQVSGGGARADASLP
ncbi:DUF4148 domain-containing protein [Paraburkholderia fungorum]|uniref:DUF4148 domain-containing protein n=1 Tax=Paraburkholderia fungorum TaxID=134537 RepID=A0A420FRX4_9BURK|nr:DUF4148 domain-containing protein [Paraburkholderia fungorum]RKF35729.1 hypothetical protein BCY88_08810 [Paraburkholderia fungorum]